MNSSFLHVKGYAYSVDMPGNKNKKQQRVFDIIIDIV